MATKQAVPSKACLLVLSGIPGSGKSTLATTLCHRLGDFLLQNISQEDLKNVASVNTIVVPYDELIPENLHLDDMSQQRWKEYREQIVRSVDKYLQDGFQGLADSVDDQSSNIWCKFCDIIRRQYKPAEYVVLVIDDNMYYSSMRYRYYQLARKYTFGFCQVFLNCDVTVALHRNAARKNVIPDDIIVGMATKIEKPNPSVNSWETNSIVADTTSNIESSILHDIAGLVWKALSNPVQQIEEVDPAIIAESRLISLTNVIHQTDQILRKIVSHKMAHLKNISGDKQTLQRLSKTYMNVRKLCLEKIKTGQVTFPVAVDEEIPSCDINSELYQQILRLFEHILKDYT